MNRTLLFLGLGFFSSPVVQAADDVRQCTVADISTYGQFERTSVSNTSGFVYTNETASDTTMTDYARDGRGQWPLDLKPRHTERMTFVIATPSGPFRIQLKITVNGEPFRAYQEAGVQAAIDVARGKPAVTRQPAFFSDNTVDENPAKVVAATESRVKASTYRRSGVDARLAGYLKTLKPLPKSINSKDEELHWMISQWLPGGRVLHAAPEFGLQHNLSPNLLHLLAGNDLELSENDIQKATAKLSKADVDGNQLVTHSEIAAATSTRVSKPMWPTDELLRLSSSDDAGGTPNLRINLELTANRSVCWLGIDRIDAMTGSQPSPTRLIHDTDFGALHVVPVSDRRTNASRLTSGQFSVGAMIQPNPLWSLADTRPDGQLDAREIARVPDMLRSLDENNDGVVAISEVPMNVKFVVSQGPWANRLLTELSTQPTITSVAGMTPAPDWFAGMDANQDGLLSTTEFLGGAEKFKEYDKDGDGILTVAEATAVSNN